MLEHTDYFFTIFIMSDFQRSEPSYGKVLNFQEGKKHVLFLYISNLNKSFQIRERPNGS